MPEFLEAWDKSEGLDLLIGRWNADYDDPDNFSHTLFHSHSGLWRHWLSEASLDGLLDEARAESHPAARETLYRRIEAMFHDSAALVPLFHDIDYRLVGPRVRGLRLRGTAPYVNYPQIGKLESVEPEPEALQPAGGLLQVPIAGVVTSLDPALMDTLEQGEVLPTIYECLTRDQGDARIVPWLAAEYRVEEEGRRYRFRLRDDVRFHDGRRLGARDVRYSLERLLQLPTADGRWMFASIKGGRALLEGRAGDLEGLRIHSALELSIELEEPVAFFPALLAFQAASIVPEGCDPARGPDGWVGTGPFRVTAFEPGQHLALERNKTYWRKGFPRSEALVFSFGVSPAETLRGFREGRFSIAGDLVPAEVEGLRRHPDHASAYREVPRLGTYYVGFNSGRGPLTDRSLRERLAGAVDVPRLVSQGVGRLAVPARSFIPPGLLGHAPGRRAAVPAGAAPAASTVELAVACHPIFFESYAPVLRAMGEAWAELGVRLRVVTKTMAEFLEAASRARVDVVVGRWQADYADPDTFVQFLHSRAGLLGRLCGRDDIDRLAERGRTEPGPAARHAIYREFEEILARESLLLPLFHEQAYRFARPEVEGLRVSFGTPTVPYDELRVRG
jgi:ABC-type transport system substrate-binding protein